MQERSGRIVIVQLLLLVLLLLLLVVVVDVVVVVAIGAPPSFAGFRSEGSGSPWLLGFARPHSKFEQFGAPCPFSDPPGG